MKRRRQRSQRRRSRYGSTSPIKTGAFVFTDIVGSSKLWDTYREKMEIAQSNHINLINELIEKHNGFLVKLIGDAFMIFFENNVNNSIRFATELQRTLKNDPIYLDETENDRIKLRIGICYGDAYEKNFTVQEHILKDYIGSSVNAASRMESEVSGEDGFAITTYDTDKIEEINNTLNDLGLEKQEIFFSDRCERLDQTRSCRLLQDLHGVKVDFAYQVFV